MVGRKRLPTVEDIQSLPYIQAIVLETLRWMPVLPLSIPHRSLEDDWYQGYLIPGGSVIMPVRVVSVPSYLLCLTASSECLVSAPVRKNLIPHYVCLARAMLHNPEDYPDPEAFNPGRFLRDGAINKEVLDPSLMAFGFGRRCVLHTLSSQCDFQWSLPQSLSWEILGSTNPASRHRLHPSHLQHRAYSIRNRHRDK